MTPKTRHRRAAIGQNLHRWRERGAREPAGTLAALRPGERARIVSVECPRARAQALRFGMGEGATVQCQTVLPCGPVVVTFGRQEIAIGRGLARRIRVQSDVS